MSPEAARDFLVFEVLTHNPQKPWEAAPRQAEGVEAGFAAVREAPAEIATFLGLLAHRELSEEQQFRRRVLEALSTSRDPVRLSLDLLPAARLGTSRWASLLAAFAAGRRPESLAEAILVFHERHADIPFARRAKATARADRHIGFFE